MTFLAEEGLTGLTFQQVEDALLKWRGVDKLEYEAESADMRSKYRWLWEQFEPTVGTLTAAVKEIQVPQPVENVQVQEDGLAFLLAKIRGSGDGHRN